MTNTICLLALLALLANRYATPANLNTLAQACRIAVGS
jgi:hypothetical protein